MVKIIIQAPKKVKKSLYHPKLKKLKVYYGLDKNIKFCQTCTYSNQKPNSEKEYKNYLKKKNQLLNLISKIYVMLALCKI